MGRAERHAGDHKPTTLQVAVDAARLHHHTCLIMRNMDNFYNQLKGEIEYGKAA